MPFNNVELLLGYNKIATILAVAGVLMWVLAYILIFLKGFKDKTYGIPAPAIVMNVTWEFIFLFIYRPDQPFVRIERWLWLVFDLPNVYLLLRYGRESQTIPEFRKYFSAIVVLAFALGFFGHITFHQRYDDPGGADAAYIINYLMSVLFVYLYFARRQATGLKVTGLSYGGAWAKLLGTLLIDLANVMTWIGHPGTHYFMIYLFTACFIFDAWYVYQMYLSRSAIAATGNVTTGPAVTAA